MGPHFNPPDFVYGPIGDVGGHEGELSLQRKLYQDNTLWRILADRSEMALLVLYEVSMLRITLGENNDGSIVRLAGRLADEFVVEAEPGLPVGRGTAADRRNRTPRGRRRRARAARGDSRRRRADRRPIDVSRDARRGASREGRVLKCEKPRATPGCQWKNRLLQTSVLNE